MRLLPLALLALASAGCAHRPVCGQIAGEVARLHCEAAAGSKPAQLQLGMRYEAGEGVQRDLARAERFYAKAARTRRRPHYVYSPAVGKERYGRAITIGTPSVDPGLPEARRRLQALRQARHGAGR